MSTTEKPVQESRLRSAAKALSWRFVATFTTMLLAWLFTGEVATAMKIGFLEFIAKFFIYYFHERAWAMVPRDAFNGFLFGRKSIAASPTAE